MKQEYSTKETIICFVAVVVVAAIYVMIKDHFSKKRAMSGVDKEAFKDMIARVLDPSWTAIFTYHNYSERKGRTTTTYYYYYAIAFKGDELLVIPVGFDDGIFSAQQPWKLPKEALSKVDFTDNGYLTEFFNQSGASILEYQTLDVTSTIDKKKCPVAIDQKEELAAYIEFMKEFTKELVA